MTTPQNEESQKPDLTDVLDTLETPHPDRHEHAKASPHQDDDELAERTQIERNEVEADRRS
jgi:hypothetical protein